MSEHNQVRHGGCDCGAVRFCVAGPMRGVVNCHCGQCRRIHGHVAAFTACRPEALSFSRDDGLKWYRSSNHASRGFCARCGASLFWRPDDGARVSVAAGALDAPTGLKTVSHIFVADKGDYYDIADDVERRPGGA